MIYLANTARGSENDCYGFKQSSNHAGNKLGMAGAGIPALTMVN